MRSFVGANATNSDVGASYAKNVKTNMNTAEINNIGVASPCPVSWDSMEGDDRSRHCDQCSLMVYNISGMTAKEVTGLIRKSETERVCIWLHLRRDGTVMTRDCPKGLAAYRKRAGTLVATAFAAILGLFSTAASAQRPPTDDSIGVRSETSVPSAVVEGIVKDPAGVPIRGAIVVVTNSEGRSITTRADDDGRFRIMNLQLDRGKNRIGVGSPGFIPFGDIFSIHSKEMISYRITLDIGKIGMIVLPTRAPAIDPRKSEKSTTFKIGRW